MQKLEYTAWAFPRPRCVFRVEAYLRVLGEPEAGREGLAWLRRQGLAAGFDFNDEDVGVDGYEPLTIRGNGKSAVKLTVIEFDGVLTVRDPDIFVAKVARGFGRAKAFGLGLMLLRR
jgi:CRISPR system Cascade subunit CasE